jgi:hypothetical protein
VSFTAEFAATNVVGLVAFDGLSISKYADPDADGINPVLKSVKNSSISCGKSLIERLNTDISSEVHLAVLFFAVVHTFGLSQAEKKDILGQ